MAEINPLRRRMIEDMTIRDLAPATQRFYVHAVAKFSQHFKQSPDRLGIEDVRAFQVHLASNGISWAVLNQIVCALRFFYGVTLGQSEVPERVHPPLPAAQLARRLSPHPPLWLLRQWSPYGQASCGMFSTRCFVSMVSPQDRLTIPNPHSSTRHPAG